MSQTLSETQPSWWLETGTEVCFSCGQLYAYHMERRCAHCDVALCFICAKKHDEEIICCACVPSVAE